MWDARRDAPVRSSSRICSGRKGSFGSLLAGRAPIVHSCAVLPVRWPWSPARPKPPRRLHHPRHHRRWYAGMKGSTRWSRRPVGCLAKSRFRRLRASCRSRRRAYGSCNWSPRAVGCPALALSQTNVSRPVRTRALSRCRSTLGRSARARAASCASQWNVTVAPLRVASVTTFAKRAGDACGLRRPIGWSSNSSGTFNYRVASSRTTPRRRTRYHRSHQSRGPPRLRFRS